MHRGVVRNIVEYGAFVTLDTLGCDGLVRINQLDNNFVEDVNEVVRERRNVLFVCICVEKVLFVCMFLWDMG